MGKLSTAFQNNILVVYDDVRDVDVRYFMSLLNGVEKMWRFTPIQIDRVTSDTDGYDSKGRIHARLRFPVKTARKRSMKHSLVFDIRLDLEKGVTAPVTFKLTAPYHSGRRFVTELRARASMDKTEGVETGIVTLGSMLAAAKYILDAMLIADGKKPAEGPVDSSTKKPAKKTAKKKTAKKKTAKKATKKTATKRTAKKPAKKKATKRTAKKKATKKATKRTAKKKATKKTATKRTAKKATKRTAKKKATKKKTTTKRAKTTSGRKPTKKKVYGAAASAPKKGSAEAKRKMAKLRAMRGKKKKARK